MSLKFEVNLPPDEGEARAKFEQKPLDVVNEGLLNFPFAARIRSAEEVE